MLRSIWALLVLFVATPVIAFFAILPGFFRPRRELSNRPAKLWSRIIISAIGARVSYEGLEHRLSEVPCIFVANHQSNADIWVMLHILPMRTKFVAKESLFKIPFMGRAMLASGFIPVDRSQRSKAIQSLDLAAERIRAGRSLILFPEGTRSRDGELKQFKKGTFHLALKAGVPIVPVVISGTWELLKPGTMRVRPGPVTVRFLPAVDTGPYQPSGIRDLLNEVHGRIATGLAEERRKQAGG